MDIFIELGIIYTNSTEICKWSRSDLGVRAVNSIVLSKLSLVLFGLFVLYLFYTQFIPLLLILLPFWLGYLISRPLCKAADFLKPKIRLPDALLALILMVLLLGIGGTLVFRLGLLIVVSVQKLIPLIPGWIEGLRTYSQTVLQVIERVYLNLPEESAGILSSAFSSIVESLSGMLSIAAQTSLKALMSLPRILIAFLIILLSTFFFTADRVRINYHFRPYIKKYIHENPYFQTFRQDVMLVAVGYLKAQLTLMTVTFSISLIGLLILGIHNAFPIALGIGLVDVIPALGPAAVYVPWAISKIILSDASTAVKLLILYSVVTVIRQLLEPKVVGHHIGIHPLLTMLSLYLGVRFLGLSGILLGPLTAITILAYYKKFSKHQIHEQ